MLKGFPLADRSYTEYTVLLGSVYFWTKQASLHKLRTSFSFVLAYRGLGGLDWLCSWLPVLRLAAILGSLIGRAILDAVRGL